YAQFIAYGHNGFDGSDDGAVVAENPAEHLPVRQHDQARMRQVVIEKAGYSRKQHVVGPVVEQRKLAVIPRVAVNLYDGAAFPVGLLQESVNKIRRPGDAIRLPVTD